MKKFFCAVMICLMPALLMTGCGETNVLTKCDSSKNGADFLSMVSSKMETFKGNIDQKIETASQTATSTENPSSKIEFNASQLTENATAQAVWTTSVWEFMDKAVKENMFAMLAYDIYEKNQVMNYYDLSFLCADTATRNNQAAMYPLKNFFVERVSVNSTEGIKKYRSALSGTENVNLNLPQPVASNPAFVDKADLAIKQWGNWLGIEVQQKSGTGETGTEIAVSTFFDMPNQDEAQSTLVDMGINDPTLTYNTTDLSLTLVYDLDDGQTYTKIVNFEPQSDGVVKKKVRKFLGNKSGTGADLSDPQEYEYTLEVPETAKYNILCNYTIAYSGVGSGIYCQQKRPNNNNIWTEFYVVKTGEVVGRIKRNYLGERITIDLLLNKNLITGKLKYSFVRSSVSNTNTKYLRNEQTLTKSFCDITSQERHLALANTEANVRVFGFWLTENSINVINAGQK